MPTVANRPSATGRKRVDLPAVSIAVSALALCEQRRRCVGLSGGLYRCWMTRSQ